MSGSHRVVLIEGDGIGPEIAEAVVEIFDAAKAPITWERHLAGITALTEHNSVLPQSTLNAIRSAAVALKAPLTTPLGQGSTVATNFRSVNVSLRVALDLYANVRPAKLMPGVPTRYEQVDLVVIRENTEGLYTGLEQEIVPGVVTSLKVSTRKACLRIAEFAFEFARKHGRKKVTAVHKANILKLSDGLATQCYREVAAQYPDIEYEEKIIDATAMQLVLTPERFDVLVMENLYGDILSDLTAGLIGGLGLAPSGNYGSSGALFEAVHGSAPDIAGKGIANPTALLLSGVEMLHFLGESVIAKRISSAVVEVYREGKALTPDVKGTKTTKDFVRSVCEHLR